MVTHWLWVREGKARDDSQVSGLATAVTSLRYGEHPLLGKTNWLGPLSLRTWRGTSDHLLPLPPPSLQCLPGFSFPLIMNSFVLPVNL